MKRRQSSSRPSEAISMDQLTRGRQVTFAAATVQLFFHAAPAPSPWLWVPTCQISSYFIILLLVTTALLLVTSITATPLRRPRYAVNVTRGPLSRSLRGGSGRLGTGPGRTRQSKLIIIHPCAHQLAIASAPMGPAPWPRARRASLGTGRPGIGPGQGNGVF